MIARMVSSDDDCHAEVSLPEPFDGYPYLVTRIGHSALRHMAVLPADWPRWRLLDLARRQAEANRLETCLCIGPSEAVFFTPDGTASDSGIIPTGIPVVDRLVLIEPVPQTDEVAARRLDLHAHAERLSPKSGYLVGDGLQGGRPAARADIDRLSGQEADGVPKGLSRCTTCRLFAGDYLALNGAGDHRTPRVLQVHCRCENHNRCAGCGETLADRRLSAYQYDEANRQVGYLAAYSAFSHRCQDTRKTAQA
jgi:hypothetical protein